MNQLFSNSSCFLRQIGVISTLLAMMFVFSAQGAVEECAQETASHELELLVVRHEVRCRDEKTIFPVSSHSKPNDQALIAPSSHRFFTVLTERSRLNGFGTYLLI